MKGETMEQYECAFAGLVGYEGIKRELSVVLAAMNRQAEVEKLGGQGSPRPPPLRSPGEREDGLR